MGRVELVQKIPVWLGLMMLGAVTLNMVPKNLPEYPMNWRIAGTVVITGGILSIFSGSVIALHLLFNGKEAG
jgi:hypothetical protein